MNTDKHAYFLSKFRASSTDELQDVSSRVNDLSDEAADALRKVASERGMPQPAEDLAPVDEQKEPSVEDRIKNTELSTALWNSSMSRNVQLMFSAQALCFSFSLLGPQGLRVGVLWILLLAAPLSWAASRLGRSYTREVCAHPERSIREKEKSLKTAAVALWPAAVLSAAAGFLIARALRGAYPSTRTPPQVKRAELVIGCLVVSPWKAAVDLPVAFDCRVPTWSGLKVRCDREQTAHLQTALLHQAVRAQIRIAQLGSIRSTGLGTIAATQG